ncbi:hypothetical protein H7U19_16505 [Hyunsoonleella sp. SJ7]|uniref:Competence protein CoiA-like family protein n=1 Tax=Hyunsoonleella aquatilis TaxID=2762758 RepID=A0A923HF34_9FLAO|nr:hypothetical protein [Hyunsoonleella aquatilis]MBC3760016.1 hypothetical protein [Hyunsoonleella aquatilis]
MSLEEKKYDIEANNDWAKNVKGEHLFIDNAQSGRKGYFCIGCDKQMEAVKKKNINHRSYFRHVPVDIVKDEKPCTFSNREYREILATDILQRLKTIKVPNLYKYPPKGNDGSPILLEKAKFVTAKKVKSQLTFYEDGNGEIKYGKNPEVEDRYLLIRPDVTFFDENDKPILLIELVITHKVNEEKKIKLRRLGIDTISIIIPKSSEQEIEDNFKTTKRVKWEYNGIEASTKYIRVSSGTSEGVLEFDEDQRRIFEESISCRKARLNNTLRTIKKCLQSEPYRRAEHEFESEISRIENATKTEKQGLEDMEIRIEREVSSELRGNFDAINSEEEEFQEHCSNLERRYTEKAKELEIEQEGVDELTEEVLDSNKSEERIRAEFEEQQQTIGQEFVERTERVKISIEREKESITGLKREKSKLAEEYRKLEEQEQRYFEAEIRRLKSEESKLDQSVREEFLRDIKQNSRRFSKGIRNILEAQTMGYDFKDAKREENRYQRARELFIKGTWKKW